MASSSSCSRSSAMRRSRSSIRRCSARARFWLRVVQSQRWRWLSSSSTVTGVAHVAAHRLVGPAHRVGVDAQVQVHELHDGVDDVVRVLQRPHPLLGHARADHLVVVEAHAAAGERAGLGLADVVEQRGQAHEQLGPRVAHHRDGVREHVLVRVDRVLLEPHLVELGQELVGEAGLGEEPQARARVVDEQRASTARRGCARRSRSRAGGAARRPRR